MKSLDSKDAYDAAEDIRLFKIQIDEFGSAILDVINRFPEMAHLKFRWQRH